MRFICSLASRGYRGPEKTRLMVDLGGKCRRYFDLVLLQGDRPIKKRVE